MLPLVDNLEGAILLAEGRLDEAEPILIASYSELRELHDEETKPVRLAEERLARLYDCLEDPERP